MANGNNIIFTKEDEREAVTITDVEDYVKETKEQLNIKDAYRKLQPHPTQTHTRLVNRSPNRWFCKLLTLR